MCICVHTHVLPEDVRVSVATKNSVCFSVTKEEFVLQSKDTWVRMWSAMTSFSQLLPSSFFGKKQKSSISRNEKKTGVSLY